MSTNDVHATQAKQAAALAKLADLQDKEQTIRRRLGLATAEGLDTSTIKKELNDVRDEIEALGAALAVHAEAVEHARSSADAAKFAAIRQELAAVVAERRKTAEEAQLLMQDLTSAVGKLASLGSRTSALARQLGKRGGGNAAHLPEWLAASLMPVSPNGVAGWPAAPRSAFAARGLPALELEALQLAEIES